MMKSIRGSSKKVDDPGLNLIVTVLCAKDLLPNTALQSTPSKCNPKCYIRLPPSSSAKTNKVKNAVSPTFNSTIKIDLKNPDLKQLHKKKSKLTADSYLILTISIWDKKTSNKNYLGELRFSVIELLQLLKQTSSNEIPFKEYKLYSSANEKRFVTGTITCKFALSLTEKEIKRQSKLNSSSSNVSGSSKLNSSSSNVSQSLKSTPLTNNGPPQILIDSHRNPEDNEEEEQDDDDDDDDELYDEELEEDDKSLASSQLTSIETIMNRYLTKLNDFLQVQKSNGVNPLVLLNLDDQGFYSIEENRNTLSLDYEFDQMSIASDDSATELDDDEEDDILTNIPELKQKNLLVSSKLSQSTDSLSGSGTPNNNFYYSSMDDSSAALDSTTSLPDQLLTPPETSEKKRRFQKLRRKKNNSGSGSGTGTDIDSSAISLTTDNLTLKRFQFTNRKDLVGILFLEVISASDLPAFKNSTRTGFDMDPFVVISFGTKVFRTSWRKHTLNPIFNERLVFEISEAEKNFDLNFNILDKDILSDNDKVCTKTLSVGGLISDTVAQLDDCKILSKNEETDPIYKRKIFGKNPRRLVSNKDYTEQLKTVEIKMDLFENEIKKKNKTRIIDDQPPKLKIRVRFEPYQLLRRRLFSELLLKFQGDDGDCENDQKMDIVELSTFLQKIGSNLNEDEISQFWEKVNKNAWVGDKLTFDEIVDEFENFYEQQTYESSKHIIQIESCPSCGSRGQSKNDSDIIRHLAICLSKDWSSVTKIIDPSYATSDSATRKWYSKALVKLVYGKVQLGKNNANILVQDRDSGLILEEKMSVYVRLGIQLLYRSFTSNQNTAKVKGILKSLSFKQGAKFDSPNSASKIESFVKFYQLDLTECLYEDLSEYKSFNEFFYRKLKPNARPIDSPDSKLVATSGADSRCCVFPSINKSKEIWIKGRNFTVGKLLSDKFDTTNFENGSLVIFRLAPQDYHRFHCSVDGTIKKIHKIEGEYYTVNPMAIRSNLDVYGENIRVIIEIQSETFGRVMMVCVGAMMVGSTVLTVKVGDRLQRGDEVGYFKFGGSTVLLLFEENRIKFDSDLLENAENAIETLVRVGMSIGHTPDSAEFERKGKYNLDAEKDEDVRRKIIRTATRIVSGAIFEDNVDEDNKHYPSWEVQNLDLDDAVDFEIEKEEQES